MPTPDDISPTMATIHTAASRTPKRSLPWSASTSMPTPQSVDVMKVIWNAQMRFS